MTSNHNSSEQSGLHSELNNITYIVLAIQCLGVIVSLFKGMFFIPINPGFGYLTLSTCIALIVALLLMLAATSKWGVCLYLATQAISCILAPSILGELYQDFVFRKIIACVIFSLVLLLEKNGKSGWATFFEKRISKTGNRSFSAKVLPTLKENKWYVVVILLGLLFLVIMAVSLCRKANSTNDNANTYTTIPKSHNSEVVDSLPADSAQVLEFNTFECKLFSFQYPASFKETEIDNAKHMVLKLEADEFFISASYWDYGVDESVDIWDDDIVNAYTNINLPKEKVSSADRINQTFCGKEVHTLRVVSETSQKVGDYTVDLRFYSYLLLHKGYLLEFCFSGAPYDGDYTYYEEILNGVTLK